MSPMISFLQSSPATSSKASLSEGFIPMMLYSPCENGRGVPASTRPASPHSFVIYTHTHTNDVLHSTCSSGSTPVLSTGRLFCPPEFSPLGLLQDFSISLYLKHPSLTLQLVHCDGDATTPLECFICF